MKYIEYKEQQIKQVSELPIKYAFGKEQFKSMMAGWGLTENDTDKIYRLGDTGGFYLRTDAEAVRNYFNKENDLEKLMQDETFREDAFLYEMNNHEYAINTYQGDWDVLSCFTNKRLKYDEIKGYREYLEEMGHSDWIESYRKARASHYQMAEKQGWF